MERTFVLLKPDCVQRRLMGQILERFENKGINIIAMKMLVVTPELSKQHYAEHVSKPFYPNLESFITAVRSWRWSLRDSKSFVSCVTCSVRQVVSRQLPARSVATIAPAAR